MSRKWFDGILAAGLSDGQYVEILGIVVAVVSMDAFCRGLGVAPHPLPAPESGEPSGYRPASAVSAGAWVPMIPPAGAVGAEADLFRPSLAPNVIRAMSLVPDAVRALNELAAVHYLPAAQVGDPRAQRALARPQMELIAARVSAARECFY